jgi:DNA-directed RNA polymerase sigma subunit (sigma70/sigma32)
LISVSETVVKATIQSGKNVISLHQPVGDDGSSTLGDKLEDANPVSDPFESLAKKEMMQIVKRVMGELSTKEAAILRLRFGLHDDISPENYKVTDDEAQLIASGQGLI